MGDLSFINVWGDRRRLYYRLLSKDCTSKPSYDPCAPAAARCLDRAQQPPTPPRPQTTQ